MLRVNQNLSEISWHSLKKRCKKELNLNEINRKAKRIFASLVVLHKIAMQASREKESHQVQNKLKKKMKQTDSWKRVMNTRIYRTALTSFFSNFEKYMALNLFGF